MSTRLVSWRVIVAPVFSGYRIIVAEIALQIQVFRDHPDKMM
jgi:hypothetical protein